MCSVWACSSAQAMTIVSFPRLANLSALHLRAGRREMSLKCLQEAEASDMSIELFDGVGPGKSDSFDTSPALTLGSTAGKSYVEPRGSHLSSQCLAHVSALVSQVCRMKSEAYTKDVCVRHSPPQCRPLAGLCLLQRRGPRCREDPEGRPSSNPKVSRKVAVHGFPPIPFLIFQ